MDEYVEVTVGFAEENAFQYAADATNSDSSPDSGNCAGDATSFEEQNSSPKRSKLEPSYGEETQDKEDTTTEVSMSDWFSLFQSADDQLAERDIEVDRMWDTVLETLVEEEEPNSLRDSETFCESDEEEFYELQEQLSFTSKEIPNDSQRKPTSLCEETACTEEKAAVDDDQKPLYPGANIRNGTVMALLILFSMRFNLPADAIGNLLFLFSLMLPAGHCLPKTLNTFKRYSYKLRNPLVLHHYCSFCLTQLEQKGATVCSNAACLCDLTKRGSVDSEDAADERKCQDVEVTSDSDSSNSLITDINEQELTDRVEILRFLQKRIIRGRELDIKCLSDTTEGGETNFICVNRDDILNTTFSELKDIQDYCITFEVDFVGEIAKDLGGPRKEWIRLMNQAMKEKYFDKGLRPYLADDYYYVGIMIGIALLQNGQLPSFIPVDIVEQLEIPNTNPCIANLQKGMDVFGLAKIIYKVPILLHLLRPSPRGIVAKHVIHLLKPKFSEAGSSMFLREKEVYSLFIKYIREVSSGRREPITLSSLLVFTTGASEEPVLGFAIQPSIEFAALSDTQPPTEDESSQLCAGDMLGTCGQTASPQVSKEFPHVLVFTALGAGEACSNRPSR